MTPARDLFDLTGRVALVTGGSRGIGQAIARGLAECGARVALASRTAADLERAVDELRADGLEAEGFPADLSRMEEVARLVDAVRARLGEVDVLVNVAGQNRRRPALEITQDDWDAVVDLNLKSVFFLCQAIGRGWIESGRYAPDAGRGRGKIVNIGSLTSVWGYELRAPYAASKSGLLGITRTLAVEWGPHGICANVLAPGWIETPLTAGIFADPAFSGWVEGHTPMARRGYASDLVGAAVFLSAPASDFVTGQTLVVDGGFLNR